MQAVYDEAMTAYTDGNYSQALAQFLHLAEHGSPDAQYNLGIMYDHGQGVAQDYQQAAA